jgi:hypothetical protein
MRETLLAAVLIALAGPQAWAEADTRADSPLPELCRALFNTNEFVYLD